jgi:large subunit ribosomal protein L29
MPILRLKEIDGMSSQERTKKLSELRAELSRLRTMVGAGGAVENPARIKELRKTIARVLTIESEQKFGIRKKETKQEKPAKKANKKKEKKQE